MKNLFWIGAAAALVVLLGLAWMVTKTPNTSRPTNAASGLNTEAFWTATLSDRQGQPQAMAQYRGQVVIVNFWAPWCPPCRAEMPGFMALQEKYGKDGVQFIGIALDTPANVQRFLAAKPTNYPIYLGEIGGSELSLALGNHTDALPYTVIIDRRGQAAGSQVGLLDEARLEAMLRPLL